MRIWEIDAARGLAVIGMLVFNYAYALRYFGLLDFDNYLFWTIFPRVVAGSFIFIAGISLSLSSGKNHARRIAVLAFLGICITVVTMVYTNAPVLFGILHLVAVSSMICLAVDRYAKKYSAAIGVFAIIIGLLLPYQNIYPLLWLFPTSIYSLDYFPLLPWSGVMLIGLHFGNNYYSKGKSRLKKINAGWLEFIGRNSLVIYVVHIPLLLLALYATGIGI